MCLIVTSLSTNYILCSYIVLLQTVLLCHIQEHVRTGPHTLTSADVVITSMVNTVKCQTSAKKTLV